MTDNAFKGMVLVLLVLIARSVIPSQLQDNTEHVLSLAEKISKMYLDANNDR